MSDTTPEKPHKKPAAKKPAHPKPAHPRTKPIPVVAPADAAPTEVVEPVVAPVVEESAEPLVVVVPPKKKRRRWPWVLGIVLVVLAILLTVAYFVGEAYAKNYARDYIKQRIIAVLGIEPGTPVKVDIGDGSVLFQALAGRLDQVDVSADTVTFGELTGAATIHAEGVPLDANAATEKLDVVFAVDEKDIGAIAGNLSGMQLDSITLEEPEIVAATTFSFFGFQIPVGMGLEPSAKDGNIVFTPTSIRLGEDTYTAQELKQSFGGFADQLLSQKSVCVNESLPVALHIVDVDVVKKDLVVAINGDGVALGGSDLSTPGTCS